MIFNIDIIYGTCYIHIFQGLAIIILFTTWNFVKNIFCKKHKIYATASKTHNETHNKITSEKPLLAYCCCYSALQNLQKYPSKKHLYNI